MLASPLPICPCSRSISPTSGSVHTLVNLSYSWGQRDPLSPAFPTTGGHGCTALAHIRTFSGRLYLAFTPGFVSTDHLPAWELSGIASVSTSWC